MTRLELAERIATIIATTDRTAKIWTKGEHVRVYVTRILSRGIDDMGYIAIAENGARDYSALRKNKAGIRDIVEARLNTEVKNRA